MNQAAVLRKKHPALCVIGIAGSVGKTTTKELLKHLLQDLSPIATPAHVNTEMGVAQWLMKSLESRVTRKERNDELKTLIIEMGAYREGEIALLAQIAQPTIGVLTTLGSDHLALFGSEDAIRRANAELIQALPKEGHAFIAITDDASRAIAKAAPCPVTMVGENGDSWASSIKDTSDGLHLTVENHQLHVPMHGKHNVGNLLLAIGVARQLGIGWERITELLPLFHPLSHTFSVHEERGVTILDDTYNISFLSFKAALDWAKDRKERPRVLLSAGLLEVGNQEAAYHAELGALAKTSVDRAIFLTPQACTAFASTFGEEAELLSEQTRVLPGSLLLCIGRMPLSIVTRLLP